MSTVLEISIKVIVPLVGTAIDRARRVLYLGEAADDVLAEFLGVEGATGSMKYREYSPRARKVAAASEFDLFTTHVAEARLTGAFAASAHPALGLSVAAAGAGTLDGEGVSETADTLSPVTTEGAAVQSPPAEEPE